MRALARPEIFEYEQEVEVINAPVYVPCLASGVESASESGSTGPYIAVTPACANPGETVQVEGFNFAPNTTGPLRFVPGSDPSNPVAIGRDIVETDDTGHFIYQMTLPKRSSDDVQYIRATLSRNVGTPRFTKTAHDTWDKIIETVFLALLATIRHHPCHSSQFHCQQPDEACQRPLSSIALSLLGWPVGLLWAIGRQVGGGIQPAIYGKHGSQHSAIIAAG
jgi:hypothetical protein